MYLIIFSPRAENQLKKLDKIIQERILNVLDRIKIRPFAHDIKRFQGTDYYRARIGDYRMILDIKQDRLIVIVIEVGHRKNIYKRNFRASANS